MSTLLHKYITKFNQKEIHLINGVHSFWCSWSSSSVSYS